MYSACLGTLRLRWAGWAAGMPRPALSGGRYAAQYAELSGEGDNDTGVAPMGRASIAAAPAKPPIAHDSDSEGWAAAGSDEVARSSPGARISVWYAGGSAPARPLSRQVEADRWLWGRFQRLWADKASSGVDGFSFHDFEQLLGGGSVAGSSDLKEVFQEMDANSDSLIAFDEFASWWRKFGSLANAPGRASSESPAARLFQRIRAEGAHSTRLCSGDEALLSVGEDAVAAGFERWAEAPEFEFDGPLDDAAEPEAPSGSQESSDGSVRRGSEVEQALAELDTLRSTHEDLQVQTITGLIEEVKVDLGGQQTTKKMLFMTNAQARKFDMSSQAKVLTAMDVAPPRLVITLLGSGIQGKNSRSATHASEGGSSHISHRVYREANEWEFVESLRRLESFMEDTVLPLAIETEALVICKGGNCYLSAAFSKASAKYAHRNDGKLPFTLMCFNHCQIIRHAAEHPGHTAYSLRMASKRGGGWNDYHKRGEHDCGDERGKWERQDLLPGCTHYILADGLDAKSNRDDDPIRDLEAEFVQRLTAELPSVAMTSFRGAWEGAAEFLSRDLPVLLLDSRPPPPREAATFAELRDQWQAQETAHTAAGCGAWAYEGTTLAQIHQTLRRVLKDDRQFERHRHMGGSSGAEERGPWIHCAIAEAERAESAQQQGLHQNADDLATPLESERASEGVHLWDAVGKLTKKVESSWTLRLLKRVQASLSEVKDIRGLDRWLEQLAITGVQDFSWSWPVDWYKALLKAHAAQSGGFLARKWGKSAVGLHCYVPQVAPKYAKDAEEAAVTDDAGRRGPQWDPEGMKAALLATMQTWEPELRENVEGDFGKNDLRNDRHLLVRNMLLQPKLHSGNLSNVKHLQHVLAQVARVNRLPDHNSIEATRILHQAWDTVDLFTHEARRSKFIAKLSYVIMLLIGAAATICTVISINRSDIISNELRGDLIVALSVVGTATAALTTYVDPGQRWSQLAAAALALESECWKFRTRSGSYAMSSTKGLALSDTEHMLLKVVHAVRKHASKSATLSETAFSSAFEVFGRSGKNPAIYKHGQYPDCGEGGTFGHAARVRRETEARAKDRQTTGNRPGDDRPILDDHHSPLPPEHYLHLRVEPMVRFYQERLPVYYRKRTVMEIVLLVGSLSGTVMSFLEVDEWAAVVAAVTAMVTAWAAFSGTKRKITRYSNTIEAIQSIVTDWKALKPIDKSNIAKIGQLVTNCEEAFEREREAWASTSMTAQLLRQAAADQDISGDDGGRKDSEKEKG